MSATVTPPVITAQDAMLDLEAGRSVALRRADRLLELRSLPRHTVGGRRFVATLAAARVLGRIHPRLARRALLALWFTPWVHPSALRTVSGDELGEVAPWSLPTTAGTLRGYAGGEGPTVVLAHGWAGRGADWRRLARDLIASGWRVVVPDLPAHGSTEGRRTDLFQLGAAVASVLDHERPAAVVAHSLGFPSTLLAFERAEHRPDLLVAVAPGRKMRHAIDTFATRLGLPPSLVEELRRGIEADYGEQVWEVLDVDHVLPDLTVRGLVVHDTEDDEVAIADARAISERWAASRLVETEGLGHRRIVRDVHVRALITAELDALLLQS